MQWVRIDEPDPELTAVGDPRSTFSQGWAQGGAKFNRLEGCWEDDGTIFFVSTSGGDAKNGDVNSDGYAEASARSGPTGPAGRAETTLVYESPSGSEMDGPDNITVTPRGGLITCEDDPSSAYVDTTRSRRHRAHQPADRADPPGRGVRAGGQRAQRVELAGACFSPSGRTLFQHLRPRPLRRGPGGGHDVRGHRAVAPRPAVITETSVHGRDGVRAARLRSRPVTPTLPATPSSLSDE